MSVIGTCQLCRRTEQRLVDSHIVPRSFYEDYGKAEMHNFGEEQRIRYRKGIYGNFLCLACEAKFQRIDEIAQLILKRQDGSSIVYSGSDGELCILADAFQHKRELHMFALAVLWRAASSCRREFAGVVLGPYMSRIRHALHQDDFDDQLLASTGIYFSHYPGGGGAGLHQAFIPHRVRNSSKDWKVTYGRFACHVFGFPYGELVIRLGGESPKQGYVVWGTNSERAGAVVWTSNLSAQYPHWMYMREAHSAAVHTAFMKKLQSIHAKKMTPNL
jgi:hypothetical protein